MDIDTMQRQAAARVAATAARNRRLMEQMGHIEMKTHRPPHPSTPAPPAPQAPPTPLLRRPAPPPPIRPAVDYRPPVSRYAPAALLQTQRTSAPAKPAPKGTTLLAGLDQEQLLILLLIVLLWDDGGSMRLMAALAYVLL